MLCSISKSCVLSLFAAGIWMLATVSEAALVIDDFDLPGPAQVIIVPNNGNPYVGQQNVASGVIGGQRDIRVADSGTGGSSIFAVGMDGSKGLFDANTAAQRTDLVMLQYDGNDVEGGTNLSDNMGLLVDLTDGGKNTDFLIRFANSQVPVTGLLNVFVSVQSLGGTSTYLGAKSNNPTPGGIPQVVDMLIPFASFGGTADFTQARSITFRFNDDGQGNGSVGADFELELLAAVPEPGSMLLALMGVVGAVAVRRSRLARAS